MNCPKCDSKENRVNTVLFNVCLKCGFCYGKTENGIDSYVKEIEVNGRIIEKFISIPEGCLPILNERKY